MMLEKKEQTEILTKLDAMAGTLHATFAGLASEELTAPGPEGSFSPVEHCWHLADLEQEGFAVRIRRLMSEENPRLPDFDGDLVARQRRYRSRSFAEGLAAFRSARRENLVTLRGIRDDAWKNTGTQDGVGKVSLCDIPLMMLEHDESHRGEIEAWLRFRAGTLRGS